jgi:fused signal recognition particle receptor
MFRKITLFSVVLTAIIIILGSITRVSDVYTSLIDQNLIKLLKGQAHDYLTGTLGLSVVLLSLLSWRQKDYKTRLVLNTSFVLLLVALQAALGYWAGDLLSYPIIITLHVLLGLFTFWNLYSVYLYTDPELETKETNSPRLWVSTLSRVAMLFLLTQIALGIWVSTNHAGLACVGFPQCNGQWFPRADFASALDVFRGLINQYNGIISYDAQVAVNWIHRVFTLAVFIVLSAVLFVSTSSASSQTVKKSGLVLGSLLFLLIVLEILAIKHNLPLWIGVVHHMVAALMMLPLIAINFYARINQGVYLRQETTVITQPVTTEVTETPSTADAGFEKYVEPLPESLYLRLKSQLKRTRSGLSGILAGLPLGSKDINDELLEEIEANLLMADVGIDATTEIIGHLTNNLERHELKDGEALTKALKEELYRILKPCSQPLQIPQQDEPFVILVVGVNGAGKTTTIGKLAKRLQAQGHSVMLAAGDTFRAAAVEQLQVWGERNNIPVVAQHTGADSASVIFDGLQSAKAKGIDVLIADTAGRLHTKSNLMEELKKIKRIMGKIDEAAPHEVLLVLDAGTGQNALSQAKLFNETVSLSGLVLTKLDGTAKGGVIFALAKHTGTPIRFIGIGEGIDDLQDFDAELFVEALFVKE